MPRADLVFLSRLSPLTGGRVLLDGVDTRTLQSQDLRKQISVIPQDPVLFSGSLRDNLDPCGEFDDAALWRALEDVTLDTAMSLVRAGFFFFFAFLIL